MQTMSVSQFRHAFDIGGIAEVTLKGEGGAFSLLVQTRYGQQAVLAKTKEKTPRIFADPRQAIKILHSCGIFDFRVDVSNWCPDKEAPNKRSRPDRSAALRLSAKADSLIRERYQASFSADLTPLSEVMKKI
jgi:hypothetical protein